MLKQVERILALSKIVVFDGLRRHALLGLIILSLAAEVGGLLFFDFISRDIGRASSDFIFSISWLSGIIFLFFHSVQVIAWDEERHVIYTLLARPISRSEYVIGIFAGQGAILLILNSILALLGWFTLMLIKYLVPVEYFIHFSNSFYLLTWLGLLSIELVILAAIILFSSMIRGGFPVLLMSVSFYAICSGLPVVRESVAQQNINSGGYDFMSLILQILTIIFPDFDRLDFKNFIVSNNFLPTTTILTNFSLAVAYIVILLWMASTIYNKRDLQ
ncbi:MAG: hypothetical protein J7L04_10765 [Bacteroidales bacterium]|nr:hypothetical protein [Bacteroidales bacterium]